MMKQLFFRYTRSNLKTEDVLVIRRFKFLSFTFSKCEIIECSMKIGENARKPRIISTRLARHSIKQKSGNRCQSIFLRLKKKKNQAVKDQLSFIYSDEASSSEMNSSVKGALNVAGDFLCRANRAENAPEQNSSATSRSNYFDRISRLI